MYPSDPVNLAAATSITGAYRERRELALVAQASPGHAGSGTGMLTADEGFLLADSFEPLRSPSCFQRSVGNVRNAP